MHSIGRNSLTVTQPTAKHKVLQRGCSTNDISNVEMFVCATQNAEVLCLYPHDCQPIKLIKRNHIRIKGFKPFSLSSLNQIEME